MRQLLVLSAVCTIAVVLPAAAQDAGKAQGIAAQVCAACHAPDGNSIAPANPKIAGQFPEYLHKQLRDFKPQAGKKPARESAVMMGMVANLSEVDMKGLATYYGGQSLRPAAASDKELAAAGQKLRASPPAPAATARPERACRPSIPGSPGSTPSTSPPS